MKLAVVLFNLGGPDSPEAVQPFLQNLFSDPAIIRLPGLIRKPLARLIARRRAVTAREIYARMGGRSPILPETEAQAEALAESLRREHPGVRVFIVMRYWHPMANAVAREVAAFAPDRIVLLPLYPQFSTTTSASSLADWAGAARAAGLSAPSVTICCYPRHAAFIAAHAALLAEGLAKVAPGQPVRVLFSAHGLPERVVKGGDPYQWQVEQTAAAVAQALGRPDLDWRVTYQSRVGPLKWIGPSTDDEIRAAGREGRSLIVTPIAFVSEHSETLVELDEEYAELAEEAGVPHYVRVPALGTHPAFIEALSAAVQRAARWPAGTVSPDEGRRLCPATWSGCPCKATA